MTLFVLFVPFQSSFSANSALDSMHQQPGVSDVVRHRIRLVQGLVALQGGELKVLLFSVVPSQIAKRQTSALSIHVLLLPPINT